MSEIRLLAGSLVEPISELESIYAFCKYRMILKVIGVYFHETHTSSGFNSTHQIITP
jgi:hypothetical protein